jgi:translation elongation factor aEF-1 beta
MADMILKFRVMPEDGEVEFETLKKAATDVVENFDSSVKIKYVEETPVGFGLKAVSIELQLDEKRGSEELENKLKELSEVGDVVLEKMDRL